jgi:hypothetical protein
VRYSALVPEAPAGWHILAGSSPAWLIMLHRIVLPGGVAVDMDEKGNVIFLTEERLYTSMSALCYIIQEYQNKFGGIPMQMGEWRGWQGTQG